MINGKQQLLEYFETINGINDHQYIFFSIHKKGTIEKGYPLIETPDATKSSGWNYDKARELLTNWLNLQKYGEFTICLNVKEGTTRRGSLRQDFTVDSSIQTVSGISAPVSEAEIDAKVEARVIAILDRKEKEKQLEDLKKELAETKKENKLLEKRANDPWTKLISGIEPYVPHILQDMGVIKTKIAGIPSSSATPVNTETQTETTESSDADNQKRLEASLRKLAEARPNDWLPLLETLAEAIETKPELADKIHLLKLL